MKFLTNSLIAVLLMSMTGRVTAEVSYYKPSSKTGTSLCVIVKDDVLVHTSQILPLNIKGGRITSESGSDQCVLVLKNLNYLLEKVDSSLNQLVKLNIYVTHEDLIQEVQRLIKELKLPAQPACTFIVTKLSDPKVLVAMDAVAVTGSNQKLSKAVIFNDDVSGFRAALLPAGRTAYISGQAVKADTLAESTKKTMEELFQTIKYLGGSPENIIQIKAFLTPMSEATAASQVIDGFFPYDSKHPISLVEWYSSLPIEIEMIVALPGEAPASRPTETVTYKTPTGMKASPVYSRVAIAEVSDRIYVSGITSKEPGNNSTRIHSVFNQLKEIVGEAHSDMQHLVKATYYVSENEISGDFGKIRKEYYNPNRPPAASKATVKSVGIPNRILLLDMIVVPAK
ncbi:RidA family protein [Gimesia fumaroli]|uniref:Aminoacrylate peracid reductase RutC n=1 Tax=Gimesia fumaroli TaxID=2527976 RepID=A0A518I794_9PLAN|nr:RidA family protein [Gimesia fumaroli]QDV48929.1 Putative aminoacrylate peracid reductase RutC [Gimesia fumaroli]